jgi:hypothetical protein
VTLDPLGYNSNQVDVFYLILASMVARLEKPTERELILLFQFQRTCIQVARDFGDAQERYLKQISEFLESPANRLKDKTKNLLVLMAYILSLPIDRLDSVIRSEEEWERLWLCILTEAVRRAADSIWSNRPEHLHQEFIETLVEGGSPSSNKTGLSIEEQRAHPFFCADVTAEGQTRSAAVSRSESAAGGRGKPVPHSGKPRQQEEEADVEEGEYEQITQRSVGITPARGAGRGRGGRGGGEGAPPRLARPIHSNFVAINERDAKMREYAANLARGSSAGGTSVSMDEEEHIPYDANFVTSEMLDSLVSFTNDLGQRGHPTIASIISLLLYTRQWIKMQRSASSLEKLVEELDSNGGVAPKTWLDGMREAFKGRATIPNSLASCFHLFGETVGEGSHAKVRSRIFSSDVVQVSRAIVVQATKFRVNKECREAIEQGKYLEPFLTPEELLRQLHENLVKSKQQQNLMNTRKEEIKYAIKRCLTTGDMLVFIGYLRNSKGLEGRRNTKAFQELYYAFQDVDSSASIPLGSEKLKVLILGEYEVDIGGGLKMNVNVLDDGKAWVPGLRRTFKKYRHNDRRFRRIWGKQYDELIELAKAKLNQ